MPSRITKPHKINTFFLFRSFTKKKILLKRTRTVQPMIYSHTRNSTLKVLVGKLHFCKRCPGQLFFFFLQSSCCSDLQHGGRQTGRSCARGSPAPLQKEGRGAAMCCTASSKGAFKYVGEANVEHTDYLNAFTSVPLEQGNIYFQLFSRYAYHTEVRNLVAITITYNCSTGDVFHIKAHSFK